MPYVGIYDSNNVFIGNQWVENLPTHLSHLTNRDGFAIPAQPEHLRRMNMPLPPTPVAVRSVEVTGPQKQAAASIPSSPNKISSAVDPRGATPSGAKVVRRGQVEPSRTGSPHQWRDTAPMAESRMYQMIANSRNSTPVVAALPQKATCQTRSKTQRSKPATRHSHAPNTRKRPLSQDKASSPQLSGLQKPQTSLHSIPQRLILPSQRNPSQPHQSPLANTARLSPFARSFTPRSPYPLPPRPPSAVIVRQQYPEMPAKAAETVHRPIYSPMVHQQMIHDHTLQYPNTSANPPGDPMLYHKHTLPQHVRGMPVHPSPQSMYFPQNAGYMNRSPAPSPDTAAFPPYGFGQLPPYPYGPSPSIASFRPSSQDDHHMLPPPSPFAVAPSPAWAPFTRLPSTVVQAPAIMPSPVIAEDDTVTSQPPVTSPAKLADNIRAASEVAASQPSSPKKPQHRLIAPAPPEPAETAQSAHGFVDAFGSHFRDDPTSLASFEALCMDYNKKACDEVNFYAGIYRILYRTGSQHLLPSFNEFLPGGWKQQDLSWLFQSIEHDVEQAKVQEEAAKIAVAEHTPKRRKKAPANGYRTVSGTQHGEDDVAVTPRKSALIAAGHTPSVNPITTPSRIVKLKIPEGAPTPQATPRSKKPTINALRTPDTLLPDRGFSYPAIAFSPNNTTSAKSIRSTAVSSSYSPAPSSSTGTPARKRGHNNSALPSSQIPHVGSVFPTRRAVLARDCKPYIHALCGKGFVHPADIKSHHGNCLKAKSRWDQSLAGEDLVKVRAHWDAHETAKIGYQNVSYTKVADGYVILDQESFDKIEAACAAVVTGGGFAHGQDLIDGEADQSVQPAREEPGEEKMVGFTRNANDTQADHVAMRKIETRVTSGSSLLKEVEDSEQKDIGSGTPTAKAAKKGNGKRKLVLAGTDGDEATVRAAAFGLRTRK